MMRRVVHRAITRGGFALLGLTAMTVGLPADEDPYQGFHCHEDGFPTFCHWGDGSDCSANLSMGADACDNGHGGVDYDACDEHGGSVWCLS